MSTMRYLWNPINQNIIREYDGAGNTVASYTTEPDLYGDIVSQRRGGKDSLYHYDGQGSTLALTDANGDITDAYAYSAFGEVTSHVGSTINPFQYIGQKGYCRDQNSEEYVIRRRVYRGGYGQWLSIDPLRMHEVYWSLYVYAANRSCNYVDPSGLLWTGLTADAAKSLCETVNLVYDKELQKEESDPIAPIQPADKERCLSRLRVLRDNPLVRSILDQFGRDQFGVRRCDRPEVSCENCPPRVAGRYSLGKRKLIICWNNISDRSDAEIANTIVHEMTHALQACYYRETASVDWGIGVTQGCVRSLLFEIEAYYCGGKAVDYGCRDFDDCFSRALGSACAGHCDKREITPRVLDLMKLYFENHKKEYCVFPREILYPPEERFSQCG